MHAVPQVRVTLATHAMTLPQLPSDVRGSHCLAAHQLAAFPVADPCETSPGVFVCCGPSSTCLPTGNSTNPNICCAVGKWRMLFRRFFQAWHMCHSTDTSHLFTESNTLLSCACRPGDLCRLLLREGQVLQQ